MPLWGEAVLYWELAEGKPYVVGYRWFDISLTALCEVMNWVVAPALKSSQFLPRHICDLV